MRRLLIQEEARPTGYSCSLKTGQKARSFSARRSRKVPSENPGATRIRYKPGVDDDARSCSRLVAPRPDTSNRAHGRLRLPIAPSSIEHVTLRARIEPIVARLIMAVFLVVGMLPQGEFVLCFDGTVALESSDDSGSCSECTGDPCSPTSFGVTSEPSCPCIDLALTRPDDCDRVVTSEQVSIDTPALAFTVPAALMPPLLRPNRIVLECPRPPDSLGSVRTVVLLI